MRIREEAPDSVAWLWQKTSQHGDVQFEASPRSQKTPLCSGADRKERPPAAVEMSVRGQTLMSWVLAVSLPL